MLEALETRRLLALDFGDVPAPYPSLAADNGAAHEAIGPTLGATRDTEPDGQPAADAGGDGADEDGVTFGSIRVGQLDARVTVNVQNAPAGAKLDAWIDFDGDGNWGGPQEHLADGLSLVNGDNAIALDVPGSAASGSTFARFRLSTAGGLAPTGGAVDGEVEDYQVTINPPAAAGPSGVRNTISAAANGAASVYAADMDGDGDMDVLSASSANDTIAWYENDGSAGFTAHTISTAADGALSVYAADMDGDGDMDALSASLRDDKIAWYENDGSQSFTDHTISSDADGARSVYAADVDGDGDLDVLSASNTDNKIAWYENDGGQGFTAHTISTDSVTLDEDFSSGEAGWTVASEGGHTDPWELTDGAFTTDGSEIGTPDQHTRLTSPFVAVASDGPLELSFDHHYSIEGDMWDAGGVFISVNEGAFTQIPNAAFTANGYTVTSSIGAHALFEGEGFGGDSPGYPANITSVANLGDFKAGDEIAVQFLMANDHLSVGPQTPNWAIDRVRITEKASASNARSVYAADVDGDGDLDVLSASFNDDRIAWYKNDGNGGFTDHTISAAADGAHSVFAADLDGDGDLDALSASYRNDRIAWYENDGGENFTARTISNTADGAISVFAADVDGDGDLDVLSASFLDNKIAWYENDGSGSFTAHSISTAANGANSVFAADVDGDGDLDVLSASTLDNRIAWYEGVGNNPNPPTVTGVTLNANETDPPNLPQGPQPTTWQRQRSDIRQITVSFSQAVIVTHDDLELVNLGVNAPLDPDVEFPLTTDHLSLDGDVLTIHFDPNELPDGVYQLTIASSVVSNSGAALDGNGDGSPGDAFILAGDDGNKFYKLVAEWNGDLGVSIFDFPAFAYWFGQAIDTSGGPAPAYMNLNDDDGVSIFDFPAFASGFGVGVTFPPMIISQRSSAVPLAPAGRDASRQKDDRPSRAIEHPLAGQEAATAFPLVELRQTGGESEVRKTHAELSDLEQVLDEIGGDVFSAWSRR